MPRVTVVFHGAYRDFAGRSRAAVEASSVGEALDGASAALPGLRERLRDEHGRLREHLNVFANEEDVRHLDGERTALSEGAVVHLVPAVSGGSA